MSKYIQASVHPAGTAAVTNHFFASDNKEAVGEASGKQFQRGITPDWDTAPNPSAGDGIFNDNIASPKLPSETGVNYTPRSQAGHTMTAKPFQGAADGLPGNAKMLWD